MYSITVYHIKSSSGISNVRFSMCSYLKWKHPELWNFFLSVIFLAWHKIHRTNTHTHKRKKWRKKKEVIANFSNTQNAHVTADMAAAVVVAAYLTRPKQLQMLCKMNTKKKENERKAQWQKIRFFCDFKLNIPKRKCLSLLFNFFFSSFVWWNGGKMMVAF